MKNIHDNLIYININKYKYFLYTYMLLYNIIANINFHCSDIYLFLEIKLNRLKKKT